MPIKRSRTLKELWVPLSGAIAQQRQVETIANNVANANTQGFKKDQIVFKEYLTALDKGHNEIDLPNKEWKPDDFYRSYGSEHSFVKTDGTYVDHSQGRLTPSSNPLDLAINGPGFFEILTPNGIRYTRNGQFTLNREGAVVNANGYPILSKLPEAIRNGDPQSIPSPQDRMVKVENGPLSVNLQGEVIQNNNKVSEISVVEFKDVQAIKKEGSTFFINNNEDNIITQNLKSAIHQGFIEESNVNALEEMSNLIKANRQFESIQRVIRTYDNIAGKSVNEISKF